MESLGVSLPNLPSLPSLPSLPPFFFHYVICILCALYLIVIAVLKFKYYYWYHQPLTFRFSVKRWYAVRRPNTFTSTMNPLRDVVGVGSVSGRGLRDVVYPFITNVNYENVKVYSTASVASISRNPPPKIPFKGIAELLNKAHKVVMNNGGCSSGQELIPYTHHERLACMLANETHGLAAFVGVYRSRLPGGVAGDIHGVCILTPRIKIERDLTSSVTASTAVPLSTSIYVCEHLAWSRYDMSDRDGLELLETTEYIQKSREIAGEQTLYRYNEIPWFVIPFTTVYTYALSLERLTTPADGRSVRGRTAGHTAIIKVSSVNFALYYAFINECSRDFRCSILNEITHLEHLIQSGIYQVYMLLLNKTRVLSVYIYGPSWAQASPESLEDASKNHRDAVHKKKTRGNRIERLHNYISQTSTAVIKYLPPVIPAKYDLSGKRVGISRKGAVRTGTTGTDADTDVYNPSAEIPRLLSSIRNKQHCETQVFVDGFIDSLKMRCRDTGTGTGTGMVLIDTIAHNYMIIDEIVRTMAGATPVIWYHKWYYVLYNAIIHRELQCKDLFMV